MDAIGSESEIPPDDKRYRQLSQQLFGVPTKKPRQQWTFYEGPFVNLTVGHLNGNGEDECNKDVKVLEVANSQKKGKKKIRGPLALGRCLICYSWVSREDRKTLLGQPMDSLSERIKEKSEDLLEFLKIISSSVRILQSTRVRPCSTRAVFEKAVKRLVTRPWCFCATCIVPSELLLSKQKQLRRLQQEVDNLQQKFLSAVRLSTALVEVDPQIQKGSVKDNGHGGDNDDADDEKSYEKTADERTKITLRMKTVNMVRRCLVGGRSAWLGMRASLLDHVDFSTEVKRKPEPLVKLIVPEKCQGKSGGGLASNTLGFENVDGANEEKKNYKPYGPRRKTSHVLNANRKRFSKDTLNIENVRNVKREISEMILECCADDVIISGAIPEVNTGKKKRRPYGPGRRNTTVESINISIANNVDIKTEPEDTVVITDTREDNNQWKKQFDHNDGDVDWMPQEDDSGDEMITPVEGDLLKEKETENSTSFNSSPVVDNKNAHRNAMARKRYHEVKEKYPDKTSLELKAHLRKIRQISNPQKMGIRNVKRRPISELKSDRANRHYIKWRLTDGERMSLPAYKKMRREQLSREQKLTENGLPARANRQTSGLKNLCWTEQDGRYYFRGTEITSNEEGKFPCPFCDRYEPTQRMKSLGLHINRHHVDVSQGYPCEQCDSKFYYNNDLLIHVQEKHGGGYQCEICGATLANRSTLFYHKRVKHHGIKPHVCEHCGKGFATRKDMTIHVRRHTGEKPFVCHVCADSFIDKPSMKLHIRRKHPDGGTENKDGGDGGEKVSPVSRQKCQ